MSKFWAKLAVFFGSSAIGILVAALALPKFRITVWGFIVAVVIFSVAQLLISPLVAKLVEKYAAAMTGMIGLLSTFVSLLIASLFTGGLRISGIFTWVLATLLVWIVTMVATVLLPRAFTPQQD